MKTAEQVLKKYIDRATSSSARESYESGINSVTENPMHKAAEADDKYLRKVEESVRSGKRRDSLMRGTLEGWKAAARSKGGARLSQGIKESEPKMRAHLAAFMPYVNEVSARIRAMPKNSDADSKARMDANFEAMKAFRRRQ